MKEYTLTEKERSQFTSNSQNWKKIFEQDLKAKIKEADTEYKKYKEDETNNMIYLQQACEKIYSAVENHLMVKYSEKERSYQGILYRVSANEKDRALLSEAVHLHYFFYNGETHMLRKVVERIYNSVRDRLKKRLR